MMKCFRIFTWLAVLTSFSGTTSAQASPAVDARPAEVRALAELGNDAPSFETLDVGEIRMRVASLGEGPVVLLLHGFPDFWYTWRELMPALARAGYRAVAPDLRGYGDTTAPADVSAYDLVELANDTANLITALGEDKVILVGHDWGAMVAWYSVLLHPGRFEALIALSVPFGGRGSASPLAGMRQRSGDRFFYMLYFQEPGVAEAELDPQPEELFRRAYASLGVACDPAAITDSAASAGGWLGRMGRPKELSSWFGQIELEYYVETFARTGFRGGLNYYRNFDRTWERTSELAGSRVTIPTMFLAGERDLVVAGRTRDQLEAQMRPLVEDLRQVELMPNVGHWAHQESPEVVQRSLLAFLSTL